MNKPIEIVAMELKKSIAETINESCLPAIILTPILKDFYHQMEKVEQQQYEKVRREYEESLNKEVVSEG